MRTLTGKRAWLALALAFLGVALAGCGGGGGSSGSSFFGSAGLRNGTIQGRVLGLVGGLPGRTPLSGVTVTATRREEPRLIRSTRSGVDGTFVLGDVPLGEWVLTFQAVGFTGGAQEGGRVFVESGGLAVAPDVVLLQTGAGGSANVTLRVVDGVTGAPVVGATVSVGGFPASSSGFDGRYFFQVPVSAGAPAAQPIFVTHPGYSSSAPTPSSVTPVPGATVSLTVSLSPSAGGVVGELRATSQDSLYASIGAFSTVSITSPQVPSGFLQAAIDPGTGRFSVQVPAGAGGVIDLVFTSPFFQQQVVAGVRLPGVSGTATLSSPVPLVPLVTTVVGSVVTTGGVPPSGTPNQVVVVETGQAAAVVAGQYQLAGVPTGLPLTLRATTIGPFGVEVGQVSVTPLAGGSFTAPTILTSP